MSAGELLGRIIPLLEAANIEHMIAGSFASTFHGEPRTTQDIVAFVNSLDDNAYYCDMEHDSDNGTVPYGSPLCQQQKQPPQRRQNQNRYTRTKPPTIATVTFKILDRAVRISCF